MYCRSKSSSEDVDFKDENVVSTLKRAATGKMPFKEIKKSKTVLTAGLVIIGLLGLTILLIYLFVCRKKSHVNLWENRRIAAKHPPVQHNNLNQRRQGRVFG